MRRLCPSGYRPEARLSAAARTHTGTWFVHIAEVTLRGRMLRHRLRDLRQDTGEALIPIEDEPGATLAGRPTSTAP